ncbi:MAG: PEP-CTERM sorting domain-containing protein [Deltaproteobacteria bacterium]|nr:PEP-CTERM sorting domain-containing protein [Deltaproteobacteria bacterium]
MMFQKMLVKETLIAKVFAWFGFFSAVMLGLAQSQVFAVTIYTDRVNWEAAATGVLTTDDFAYSISSADSIIFSSGVKSTRNSTNANTVNGNSYVGQVTGTSTLSWEFPWEVSAFGFDVVSINNGTRITGDFDGTGNQSIIPGILSGSTYYNGFVGIIGESDFNSVLFTGSLTDMFVIDNLSFNRNASTVPEPAAILLFGSGILGIAGVSRKKKLYLP